MATYYYTNTASTTGTASDLIWTGWVTASTDYTTTATTDAGTTWRIWVNAGGTAQPTFYQTAVQATRSRLDILREKRRALHERLREKLARKRARALLNEQLTEAQRASLAAKGEFEVEAQSGKRYVITRGRAGNVYSLDEHRKKVMRHCIHPTDYVPDEDTMLAQLLWLKWSEQEFMKIANHTRIAA